MSHRVIKVCGVRTPDIATTALDAGATHLGVVFAPSPRRMTVEAATTLVRAVPGPWVGVFVDPERDFVERVAEALDLAAIQLHGQESPALCERLRSVTGCAVWKALTWMGREEVGPYIGTVDAILVDSGSGGGKRLPWGDVGAALAERSFDWILAGGLDPHNVAEAIAESGADGVDASSRLELKPGVKSPEAVRAFVRAAAETMASRA